MVSTTPQLAGLGKQPDQLLPALDVQRGDPEKRATRTWRTVCSTVRLPPDRHGRAMASDRRFEEFYAASYGRLVGQLVPITGSLEEAEDVCQEAFARAAVRWSRLRDFDAPEAWVRRVALNL